MGKEFLLEVGTEEIPAGILPATLEQMRSASGRHLKEFRLSADSLEVWGTPRRLVLFADGLPDRQASLEREILGPSKKIAYDSEGKPTPAAVGFAKSQQIDVARLTVKETEKGSYLCAVRREPCKPARTALADFVAALLSGLAFPKSMVWNATAVRFVRPIRWILALYGGKVVPLTYAGVKSGDRTWGHRQMSKGTARVRGVKDYLRSCETRRVMVDPAKRFETIRRDLQVSASRMKGSVLEDEGLLSQAVYSVEYPTVFGGAFDPVYLDLPREVLVTVFRRHQYYFCVLDGKGNLLPKFLAVSGQKAKQMDGIRHGNERVLRARLEDARFFLKEDLKIRLEDRVSKLSGMIFQERLGTVLEKVERVKRLSGFAADALDSRSKEAAVRAAALSKADLLTGMVGEFPELQGVMGREYAKRTGEEEAVSDAVGEQYLPRFAGDALPGTSAGRILAVADKLDTLAGCFAAGLVPSGSQDPYALRRQAQGVVQILIASRTHVSLRKLATAALGAFDRRLTFDRRAVLDGMAEFLRQRLLSHLEGLGNRYDLVDAVSAVAADDPFEASERVRALTAFRRKTDFDALIIPFKRALNILPEGFSEALFPEALAHPAEKGLREACVRASRKKDESPRGKSGSGEDEWRHEALLRTMAELKGPIDRFFDEVLVMDPDPGIRDNRLALLKSVVDLFSSFADFRKVAVEAGTGTAQKNAQ